MAVKIPFVVQPNLKPTKEQVGTEASGKVEIERRGYISVAEKAFVQAATEDDDSQGRLYALVTKIASETGHSSQEVLNDISGGQPPAYVDPYLEQFVNCMAAMERFQIQVSVMAATALMVNRVNPKITVEQVMELHPELIEALHKFYNEEEAGSLERLNDSSENKEAEDGEESGKPSEAS
jgi:23S rRNA A2030 N6-methylase RlmJ